MHMHAHMCRLRMYVSGDDLLQLTVRVIKTGIWSQAPSCSDCCLQFERSTWKCLLLEFRITHWEHFRACSYMIIHILLVLTNPRPRPTLGKSASEDEGCPCVTPIAAAESGIEEILLGSNNDLCQ